MIDSSGTGVLAELAVRRDRIRIPAWVLAISWSIVVLASSYSTIYPSQQARDARAELIVSPIAAALSGPGFGVDHYTRGAMIANELGAFAMVAVAVMSVLMVTRHLRGEEETGRAELVRGGVVGRCAAVTSGIAPAVVTNVFIALFVLVGLTAIGLPPVGSLNLAAGILMVGLVFTALAAFMSQLTEHTRHASGLGLSAIALAYLLRAAGDVHEPHSGSALTWLSPFGWSQATRAYVDERWWPLLLAAAAAAVALGCAALAIGRRDAGAGLVATRPGKAEAGPRLGGIASLTLRLQRGQMTIWGLGLVTLALPIGASSITDDAYALYLNILAIMAAMYALVAVASIRREEATGRAGDVLAGPVSRNHWLGAQVAVIVAVTSAIVLGCGLGMGAAGALTRSDGALFARLLGAAVNTLPAVLVIVGLCVWMYGHAPRALTPLWGYLGYVLAAEIFGDALPEEFGLLSPFHYTPNLPVDDFSAWPILILLAVAATMTGLGVAGFARRDVGR